jgi:hypothetical protein
LVSRFVDRKDFIQSSAPCRISFQASRQHGAEWELQVLNINPSLGPALRQGFVQGGAKAPNIGCRRGIHFYALGSQVGCAYWPNQRALTSIPHRFHRELDCVSYGKDLRGRDGPMNKVPYVKSI